MPSPTISTRPALRVDDPSDPKPFDPSVGALPGNYHGIDPAIIYEKLERRKLSALKDEFETTEQFRQRIKREEAAPLVGSLMLDSLMAFEVKEIEAAYDADRELMRVWIEFRLVDYGGNNEPLRGVKLKSENSRASNILFSNYQSFGIIKNDIDAREAIAMQIKMDIPTARQAKQNLRALAVVKLRSPYLNERLYSSILLAELMELWVYDIATGQVLIKLKAGEIKTADNADGKPVEAAGTSDLVTRALDLYQAGRDDEALLELRRVLTMQPMNAEAYLLKGRIYIRRGDQETAISALKTALFWDAKLIDGHILLGRIFLDRNDRAQAMTYARSAMQIDPNNQEAIGLQRQIETVH